MIVWSVFQGGLAFAMLASVFLVESWSGMVADEVRALTFFALIAEIVALILVNRSFNASLGAAFLRHNPALPYVSGSIGVVTAMILFVPSAQTLLKFGSIAGRDMALAIGSGLVLLLLLETCKPLVRQMMARAYARRAIDRAATA